MSFVYCQCQILSPWEKRKIVVLTNLLSTVRSLSFPFVFFEKYPLNDDCKENEKFLFLILDKEKHEKVRWFLFFLRTQTQFPSSSSSMIQCHSFSISSSITNTYLSNWILQQETMISASFWYLCYFKLM